MHIPADLPPAHQQVLERIEPTVPDLPWLSCLLAMGSVAAGTADEFSDLDLILVVQDASFESVLAQKLEIVERFGRTLSKFSGEHVGMPNLVLCLYADPLLHADILFERADQTARRKHPMTILWARDPFDFETTERYIEPLDPQWVEDRIWVWIHKAATKIGRGEVFDGVDYTVHLRSRVLGPLALAKAGRNPLGTKGIDLEMPEVALALARTVPRYDRRECLLAIRACAEFYRSIREAEGALVYRKEAEEQVMALLESLLP
jgi:predicted nucleotidyltransferase